MSSNVVRFENNSVKVLGKISNEINVWLEEASGEIESHAKRNTPVGKVGGGNTKGKWQHKVDDDKHEAVIGNTEQTAIWIELGTGDYALNGDGRKGGWYIPIGSGSGQISQSVVDAYGFKVVYGKNKMKYAYTRGMKPKRVLHNAVESNKAKLQRNLTQRLKGLGD